MSFLLNLRPACQTREFLYHCCIHKNRTPSKGVLFVPEAGVEPALLKGTGF